MDKDVIHDIFFKISKQVVISTVIVGRLRLSWSGISTAKQPHNQPTGSNGSLHQKGLRSSRAGR